MFQAIRRFFDGIREDVRKESREWRLRCGSCGAERSLAAAGGIRWKAYGVANTVGFCSRCGDLRPMKIYHPVKAPLP